MTTITDVAARAAVSKATVSRAFSRPETVRQDTREHVLAVARDLGYTPNRIARSLSRGRTSNLGLLVPDISNPFFPPLIKAVQSEAGRRDLALFIADSDEHADDEARQVSAMAQQVDGLVLASPRMSDAQVLDLLEQVPVVVINRRIDGVPAVLTTAEEGINQAVEHLVALGHKRAAWLAGPPGTYASHDREQSLHAAARRYGLEVVPLGPFEPRFSAGLRAADLVLATGVQAVVAYNDLIALGLMQQLHERGVQVGTRISVIGIDDAWIAPMASPALTTVRVPGALAGTAAVRLLCDVLAAGNSVAASPVRLPTELIVRASTGPLRS